MKRILRYVSDLHLELLPNLNSQEALWNFPKENDTSYYLALVGDISNVRDLKLKLFLERVSLEYKYIFYVPGNHEYYNLDQTVEPKTMKQIKESMENLCKEFDNVIWLDNKTFELDGFLIIGTTLWSQVPPSDKVYIETMINDYNLIYTDKNKKLLVDTSNKLNKESIKFIKDSLNKNADKNVIVLTHHAPLFSDEKTGKYTADPAYLFGKNNYAFHNDLRYMIKTPIKLWVYGHTHYANKFYFNGVLIATNQLGYTNEQEFIRFDPNESIDLDFLTL